jgi:hypothetical protein
LCLPTGRRRRPRSRGRIKPAKRPGGLNPTEQKRAGTARLRQTTVRAAFEIAEITRFPSAKTRGYAGLCPTATRSGEPDRRGPLTL